MFANRCVGGIRIPCFVFYIVAIIAIFAYGYLLRKMSYPDVLEREVTSNPAWTNCDGWAMIHLFFWTFLGLWYPGRYGQVLIVSLVWEGFEDFLGRTKITVGGSRLQLVGETDDATKAPVEGENFWFGRYTTDSFFNLAGYIVGSALAKRFWPEDSCNCHLCVNAAQLRTPAPPKRV